MLHYLAAVEDPDIGLALVQLKPAALDHYLDARAELRATATVLVHERRVDFLDVDAAVLDGLDACGDLHELAGGGFRSAQRRSAAYFIADKSIY